MASKDPETYCCTKWKEIGPLDRISCHSPLVKKIPAPRATVTLLLVTMCFAADKHAVLYHCQIDGQLRTYLLGEWDDLGLDDVNKENECRELRGKVLIQALISYWGSAYVLSDGGELYSLGYNLYSQLGRSTQDVAVTCFGRVGIRDTVLSIACGWRHCLALTDTKVFAFGHSELGQTGIPDVREVSEPTEVYAGTGIKAPRQIAAGDNHSVILNEKGQVFTFGYGGDGRTGHSTTVIMYRPTLVKGLKTRVQQVGCTGGATYFLTEGVLLGCGQNENGVLGVGHRGDVFEPALINTRGHRIKSFRCSETIVVALTMSGVALFWGECCDDVTVPLPRVVHGSNFPRDVFVRGLCQDAGGSVYPVWTLQHSCRDAILQSLHGHRFDELPLPTKLQMFLKYGI